LIKNSANVGFPSAANQGINNSLGDYVLLLNNDTVVTENWLERMLEIAESEDKIGIVGPISNEVSGLQIDKTASYKDMHEMHSYAKKIAQKNAGVTLNFPRVAFLCTLIKKEVVEKIGGLDERFTPGNYEDDDFCLRAQLAGFKTVIAKDVFIHHYGSKSFKADGENKYAERLEINKQKFIGKWGVTPDELWIQRKEIKPHQYYYPISKNKFDEQFERARILLADNEIDLAFESLQNALEHFHKVDQRKNQIELNELLDLAGNLALANGEIELAQKYFAEELNIHPNSSSACAGLAEVFLAQELFENAKTMYEWAVKNDPTNKSAIEALINVNVELGLEPAHNSLEEESV
jgi:GT2 family glycosyltransferase